MIIAITPTGDRLHQFEICYELMMRQNVKPDRWIIVDDGVQKLQNIVNQKINNMEIVIIQREPNPNKITLKQNILAVLDKINIDDKIIFFEDDDFYPKTYVETMSKFLDDYIVVGGLVRRYYNLKFKGNQEFIKNSFGTLGSTAFKVSKKTINFMREICLDDIGYNIDVYFWRKIKSVGISNLLHSDERAQVIGVKGWNVGRKGAVARTHEGSHRKYIYDTNFNILNSYFDDMSDKYKSFIKHGLLIDIWRHFIGEVYKFRAFLKKRKN